MCSSDLVLGVFGGVVCVYRMFGLLNLNHHADYLSLPAHLVVDQSGTPPPHAFVSPSAALWVSVKQMVQFQIGQQQQEFYPIVFQWAIVPLQLAFRENGFDLIAFRLNGIALQLASPVMEPDRMVVA